MTRPNHLFLAHDGSLSDTRQYDWAINPLRPNFCRHHRDINSAADLKATLRAGSTTTYGGYPVYLMAADGSVYSFAGVKANLSQHIAAWNDPARTSRYFDGAMLIVSCCINYEDDLHCEWTGDRIPSAYGEDE